MQKRDGDSLVAARPVGSSPKTNAKPSRPVDDGQHRFLGVRNKNPEYTYVLVSKAGTAIDEYIDMGYEAVTWDIDEHGEPRGPYIMSGRKSDRKHGAEISARDHLLMAISNERWQEINENGPWGDQGQAHADHLEKEIMKENFNRPLQGIVGQYARIQAEPGHGLNQ